MEFNVHEIDWNDEKVKRFWDFYNNYTAFEDHWFSKAFSNYYKVRGETYTERKSAGLRNWQGTSALYIAQQKYRIKGLQLLGNH